MYNNRHSHICSNFAKKMSEFHPYLVYDIFWQCMLSLLLHPLQNKFTRNIITPLATDTTQHTTAVEFKGVWGDDVRVE